MSSSKCTICANEKSRFIKDQEEKGLSSSLGIKIPLLNQMPILDDALI